MMKPQTKNLLILIALFIATFTKAQEAQSNSFSLQQAIDYALKNNAVYLNSELDYQSADAKRKEVTGMGLPQINGSIDLKDYLSLPTSLLPGQIFGGAAGSFIPVKFGTKYNATAGFSASQLIFSSDYIFGLKGSKEFMNLAQVNVYRNRTELAAGVTKAYLIYVMTKERIKLAEANVTRTKTLFDNLKANNQQGFVELIDVQRAEVDYNNAIVDRDKALRSIANIEALLKFQMGYKMNDPIALSDSLNITDSDMQELALKADISKRPDFLATQGQQRYLDLDLKRLKYGYLPTLSAYGSYQYNAQRNSFNLLAFDKNDVNKQWFKIALIGVTLNVNIFDGLQRNYKIQQAAIASMKNQNMMKLIEINADAEVSTSSMNFSTSYQNFQNQKKNMEISQHVYDVAIKKYEAGLGSNIEVVLAQNQITATQINYYNALYEMIIAKTDYLKATGNLIK